MSHKIDNIELGASKTAVTLISIVAILIYNFYVFLGLFVIDDIPYAIACFLYNPGTVAALILNLKGRYTLAKFLLILNNCLVVSFSFQAFDLSYLSLAIFLPLLLGTIFLVDLRKERNVFIFSISMVVLFFAANMLLGKLPFLQMTVSPVATDFNNQINSFSAVLFTCFLSVIFMQDQIRIQKILTAKTNELEETILRLNEGKNQIVRSEKMTTVRLVSSELSASLKASLGDLKERINMLVQESEQPKPKIELIEEYEGQVKIEVNHIQKIVQKLNDLNEVKGNSPQNHH